MSPVGRLVFNTSEAPFVCLVGSTPTSFATKIVVLFLPAGCYDFVGSKLQGYIVP